MLESMIRIQRTSNYKADRSIEEAARMIIVTMGQALCDWDHETMQAILSDGTNAKVGTIMRVRGSGGSYSALHAKDDKEEGVHTLAATRMDQRLLNIVSHQAGCIDKKEITKKTRQK